MTRARRRIKFWSAISGPWAWLTGSKLCSMLRPPAVQNSQVLFLLIGEGAEKERIKSLAQSRGLTNVRFLDQQPREKIPAFISASDALPRAPEENRCLQDRDSHQDVGVHVLRPPGDSRGGWSGPPDSRRRWRWPRDRIDFEDLSRSDGGTDRWHPNNISLGHQRLVGVGVKQPAQAVLKAVRVDLQVEQPPVAVGIGVDQLRVALQISR